MKIRSGEFCVVVVNITAQWSNLMQKFVLIFTFLLIRSYFDPEFNQLDSNRPELHVVKMDMLHINRSECRTRIVLRLSPRCYVNFNTYHWLCIDTTPQPKVTSSPLSICRQEMGNGIVRMTPRMSDHIEVTDIPNSKQHTHAVAVNARDEF